MPIFNFWILFYLIVKSDSFISNFFFIFSEKQTVDDLHSSRATLRFENTAKIPRSTSSGNEEICASSFLYRYTIECFHQVLRRCNIDFVYYIVYIFMSFFSIDDTFHIQNTCASMSYAFYFRHVIEKNQFFPIDTDNIMYRFERKANYDHVLILHR